MGKYIWIPIVIGSVLLVVGGAIFGVGLARSFADTKIETKTVEITEPIGDFAFDLDTSNLEFKVSDETKVVYEDKESSYHEVKVENNTLSIVQKSNRKWYKLFDFGSLHVTVYSPIFAFNNLTIKSSTGDVTIPEGYVFNNADIKLSTGNVRFKATVLESTKVEVTTGDVYLSDFNTKELTVKSSTGKINIDKMEVTNDASFQASTGKINVKDFTANNLTAKASTGKITLTNVVIANHLQLSASTGDIKLVDSDASSLDISTSTGDVDCVLLTGKIFDVDTDTGKKHVPASSGTGQCKVRTSTGDINIQIKG